MGKISYDDFTAKDQ